MLIVGMNHLILLLMKLCISQFLSVANDLGGALSLLLGICGITILDMMISSGGLITKLFCPARTNSNKMKAKINEQTVPTITTSNSTTTSSPSNDYSMPRPAETFWDVVQRGTSQDIHAQKRMFLNR